MARSKSVPGSKTNRATTNKEQVGTGSSTNLPEVKAAAVAVPAAPPEVKPDAGMKQAADARAVPEARAAAEPKVIAESKVASEGRKFEVLKNDSRKNLVPINLDDEIRRRAYELYQHRGSGSGSEADDWLTAEREIRQRYHQQSA